MTSDSLSVQQQHAAAAAARRWQLECVIASRPIRSWDSCEQYPVRSICRKLMTWRCKCAGCNYNTWRHITYLAHHGFPISKHRSRNQPNSLWKHDISRWPIKYARIQGTLTDRVWQIYGPQSGSVWRLCTSLLSACDASDVFVSASWSDVIMT